MSCGVGRRGSSDLALLWLWCRPAAPALIRPLAWEPPWLYKTLICLFLWPSLSSVHWFQCEASPNFQRCSKQLPSISSLCCVCSSQSPGKRNFSLPGSVCMVRAQHRDGVVSERGSFTVTMWKERGDSLEAKP